MNYLEKIKRHNIDKKYLTEKMTQDDAFKNLCYFINLIQDFEYFIFFGTLLGLTRENNIIDGDDDVDFYVNEKHRDNLIEILKSNSIEVNKTLHTNRDKSFLQVVRIHNNKAYLVDFYFYDGEHSYENQYENLEIADYFLNEGAIIMIDDINFSGVENGSKDFVNKYSSKYEIIKEVKTFNNHCHPSFWNGVMIIRKK